ncbi:MAG: hypothetical protein IKN85_01660 [Oscillospiraceae bacterium]|nr:hypothetical protein [Oscillospiraceae bacterium]MBR6834502.1 hypothetical protein [Oscillospiraceae bacterium]
MTTIKEELAATARWVGNDSTMERCKNNENSVLFTYTNEGSMIIAGMVGKEDVEPLTKHIIKTLMEPLTQKSKEKYLLWLAENIFIMLSEIAKKQEDDDIQGKY